MKRPIQLGLLLLCVLCLTGESWVVMAASQSKSAKPAVLVDDALVACFEEIDQKSTTVVAGPRDPDLLPPELPAELVKLREQMSKRLAHLDSVRKRSFAGENNRGFLDLRGPQNRDVQEVVADENTDRLAAYQIIATLSKSDVNRVGKLRAEKIAVGARRGIWVQDKEGGWYQKI